MSISLLFKTLKKLKKNQLIVTPYKKGFKVIAVQLIKEVDAQIRFPNNPYGGLIEPVKKYKNGKPVASSGCKLTKVYLIQ